MKATKEEWEGVSLAAKMLLSVAKTICQRPLNGKIFWTEDIVTDFGVLSKIRKTKFLQVY